MSEAEEGKAQKVGFSTDQATVDAINEAAVEIIKKAGRSVPVSKVITLLLGVGWKYTEECLKTEEDLDVPIRQAQGEFRAKMEELKK